jgi:hypothetical protein
VIRRHTDQRGVAGIRGIELDCAGDVARKVVVRQLNGFGLRSRARREQHHADVVGVGEFLSGHGGAGGLDELVGADHLLARSGDDIAVLGVGDHQGGGQTVDQLPQAILAEPVVQRRERHARSGGRE